MFNKNYFFAAMMISILAVSGCQTTNRTAPAYDSNSARLAALQSENAQKDAEIQRLQDQAKQEADARAAAEAEKQAMAQKLDESMADLENAKAKSAYVKKTESSDLK